MERKTTLHLFFVPPFQLDEPLRQPEFECGPWEVPSSEGAVVVLREVVSDAYVMFSRNAHRGTGNVRMYECRLSMESWQEQPAHTLLKRLARHVSKEFAAHLASAGKEDAHPKWRSKLVIRIDYEDNVGEEPKAIVVGRFHGELSPQGLGRPPIECSETIAVDEHVLPKALEWVKVLFPL